ncbi:7SK snRNA methylphosphate capping enzyme [Acyrthosiphon pisum]|uniref:RNA methyltransferase n=1 Tax=Acyrthosiphon pisum TaxID=7029 RepID=A0A8R2NLE9_ACYPI|nr:7SK snRNA methylphosphate capping enzyme [Acyrthosiphon pisum]
MLLIMATKTEVENETIEKPLENQDLNAVCTNLQFCDDKIKLYPTRKRCVSTSILISASPKKKKKEDQNIIPPKKFLLGGSMSDPLNLNSLQNEDINKAMNKTPKSSPLHSNTVNIKKDQVNVIIPRNLSDPLELSKCDEAKAIACSGVDSLKPKTPYPNYYLLIAIFKFVLFSFKPECNKEKKREVEEEIISSPPNKKLKTELLENCMSESENNKVSCEIIEVVETIIDVLVQEVLVSLDECNIPISKAPVEVVVEKILEPCKTLSPSPEKKVDDGKETQEQREKIKPKRCVVSPVVMQPSLSEKHSVHQQVVVTTAKPKQKVNKKFKEKNALFKYGNYTRYYGYRNPDDEDNRLKVLAERTDLFYGKDVLDIGCNIGHVTFSVARDFGAKSVVGMDIDRKLINIARKNVQYYINDTAQSSSYLSSNYHFKDFAPRNRNDSNSDIIESFPISLPMLYGPINLAGLTLSGRFPYNVSFVQGNYVLESDLLLSLETCKFDVILCLSITKWLHLNWGDDGLKRAFKRMFAQLRPGGILVVEPQPWKSYSRRKTLTETIWRNYKNILLKPPMFTDYLLNEVGFANCETLTMPHNPSKGFQRPLKLFRKPNILVNRNKPKSTIVQPNETQKL